MEKKVPMRRCLATNESCPKKDLLRIVKTETGEIIVDMTGKRNGHGAYIKKTPEAVEIARKRKVFEKAFATNVPDSLYAAIIKAING